MRRLFVCVLLLSGGCADRNFVNRGGVVGDPASGVGVPASGDATAPSAATAPSVARTPPGFPREALRGESLSATSDELIEEKRREPRPALDPNAAPETTNYD